MSNFFAELRRRKVLRMAGLYLVGAWLLLQVANVVLPIFGAPQWILRALVITLAAGVLPALALSWAFELTPDGWRRDAGPAPDAAPTPRSTRRVDRMLVVGLLAVIGLLVAERFWPDAGASAAAGANGALPLGERSVAVLPFVNSSADAAQDDFANGVTDELRQALARLPGLQVVGRSSSYAFQGRNEDLRAIGSKLGVRHLVSGTVRSQGERVRVGVELVRADDGFEVWSETYERDLTDIFRVQDEITAAILAALQPELGASAIRPSAVLPVDVYATYLRARQDLARRGIESLERAVGGFRAVQQSAPTYAPALSGLGMALYLLDAYQRTVANRPTPEFTRAACAAAQDAARAALRLDPDLAEAHVVLGAIAFDVDWDWEVAERELARARELAPGDAEILNFCGDFLGLMLHPDALATERQAISLNPMHAVNHHDLGLANLAFRDFAGAHAAFAAAEALGFYEEVPALRETTALPLIELGRLTEARAVAEKLESGSVVERNLALITRLGIALAEDSGEVTRLLAELSALAEAGEVGPTEVAWKYLRAGRPEDAAPWIERAYAERDFLLVEPYPMDLPEHLPDHPAVRAALDKPELNDLYARRRVNLAAAAPR